jgi:glycosyltransferase involved in cell wall biosynthesis
MISVCVPVTNREKTIESCLDSLRAQSVNPQQVIVTEFGSSDNSRSIITDYIKKYSLNDKWFFYCRDEKPSGAEDWNFPLNFVEMDYVAILEGDDEWPEDYIKNISEAIEANPSVKLIFSGLYNSKGIQDVDPKVVKNSDALKKFSNLKWMTAPSQTVFKFDANLLGFFKTDKYFYAPEMQYWSELAMQEGCVVFLSKNLVFRRISDVSKFSPLYFNDHFKFLNWLKEKDLISIAGLYIRKLNLFGYNFLRFLVRAITNKKNADGTLFALIKNLLRL